MNKFAKYIKERKNAELYEDENGFFTYRVLGEDFFIDDIFVLEEKRNNGIGKLYSDKIDNLSKESGCKRNICTVCVRADNYLESFKFIQKMGYTVDKTENVLIYLIKEL